MRGFKPLVPRSLRPPHTRQPTGMHTGEHREVYRLFFFRRTPGASPLVNSIPAASNARWIASTVRGFNGSPASNLATVLGATFANLAISRIPNLSAARAIRD